MAAEHRIRGGKVGKLYSEIRDILLREPFGVYLKPVEERMMEQTIVDFRSVVAGLLTLFVPLGLDAIAVSIPKQETLKGILAAAAGVSLILGLVTTIYFLGTAGSRYLKKSVLPHLARGLKPLQPTELESILARLKSKKIKIGKKIKPKKLMEFIDAHVDEYATEEDLLGNLSHAR